jgi:hypothetical protein
MEWMVGALTLAGFLGAFPDDEDHVVPCRPTIACTADFVAPGIVELELGYLDRRLGDGANQQSVPFLLKLTLAEWVQLQVGSNGPTTSSAPSSARFFDDVTVGLKFHLLDQTAHVPSLSFSATASLPLASSEGYLRTYDALLAAYVTKDLAWLHVDWNVGLNVWRIEAAPAPQLWSALAVSVALPRGIGPMAELYGFSSALPIEGEDAGVLVALSYQPAHWVVVDAGYDVGLIPATRRSSVFVGMTVIPVALWDTEAELAARAARRRAHEH